MKKEAARMGGAFFIVASSLFSPPGCSETGKDFKPSANITDISPELMPGWKHFVSENFDYEIDVPPGWRAVSEKNGERKQDRMFLYPNHKIPAIVIGNEEIGGLSLSDRLQNEIRTMERKSFDLVSISEVEIAGEKARIIYFSNSRLHPQTPLDIYSVLFFAKGKAWLIRLGQSSLSPQKEKNDLQVKFRHMLKTLRFSGGK